MQKVEDLHQKQEDQKMQEKIVQKEQEQENHKLRGEETGVARDAGRVRDACIRSTAGGKGGGSDHLGDFGGYAMPLDCWW